MSMLKIYYFQIPSEYEWLLKAKINTLQNDVHGACTRKSITKEKSYGIEVKCYKIHMLHRKNYNN